MMRDEAREEEMLGVDSTEHRTSEHVDLYQEMSQIRAEWLQFISTGNTGLVRSLRPEVLSSWKRSYEGGIDPSYLRAAVLSKKELSERLETNRPLIHIASPLLEAFVSSIKGSDFRVDLIDRDLFILMQFGESNVLQASARRGSSVAVSRAESEVGTNAICLASLLQSPMQLVGPEHYNSCLQQLTCSAAPLFDADHEFIGVINVAGPCEKVQLHTLGMTVALSKAIELSYLQHRVMKEKELAYQYIESIVDSISEGLIALNDEGLISVINQRASKILDLRQNEVLGRSAEELFGQDSTIFNTSYSRESHIERELVFTQKNKRKVVIGNCIPVSASDGTKSVVSVFKELSRARGFVKNVVGFKAYFTFDDLLGKSASFLNALNLAKHAAPLPSNILLLGESGTGKELLAHAIHNASHVRNGPFIGINCGAIPMGLIESELFGYEGGAFTGAKREGQPGKLELAEDGSLFLDEIDSMPVATQATLLRVLQNRRFTRVGGTSEIIFNARILVASNKDLWEEVRQGNFRKDLFYRINVITIEIPRLRDRKEDIYELARQFTTKLSERLDFTFTLSDDSLEIMAEHSWPGNVRELENVIERCAVMAYSRGSQCIDRSDLLTYAGFHRTTDSEAPLEDDKNISLDYLERRTILKTLSETGNNISDTARKLGVTRNTVYNKIRKYKIPVNKSNRN
jgi:sigma-54 dependent transcriptional regulator, acetoin dehydrogenase operon transcriptional activator AcoR